MEREAVILEKSRLADWVEALKSGYMVCGPVKGNKEYNFQEINDAGELALEYTRTVIPPKKYIHPPREVLHSYDREEEETGWELPVIDKKTVVLGVHPCDARAIGVYDKVFGGDIPDPYYWNRRKNVIIVAITCTVPDDKCFCLSWNECGPTMDQDGYDLLMTDIGDSYFIQVGSLEGSLLVQHDFFSPADEDHLENKYMAVADSGEKVQKLISDAPHLPQFLEDNYNHDAWDVETSKCVSCGTCTLVCPTCFCYHVEDFNRWNTREGQRIRMWDSCQLIDFAEVAMGENFRQDRGARLKWRIYHKLAYWQEQFGTNGCTGCGRCMEYCIADIDMTRAIATIKGETDNE